MKNITIIGGGACGTAVFIELLLQAATSGLADKIKIYIIEKHEKLGYGLAFGTEQPGHLLNTQAELMGIHVHEPEHFSQWLKQHGGKNRKDVKGEGESDHTYTTRRLYGNYVSGQLNHYLEKAKKIGLAVDIIHAEAVDIQRLANSYEVICLDGQRVPCDFIILAPGTPKPNNYTELLSYPAYIDFPWPSYKIINSVKPSDHVGILGTSLSAIDAVMTVVDNGHKGDISLFSPDGMLPRVQPEESRSYERSILTLSHIHKIKRATLRKVGVNEVFKLFQQEVEAHAGDQINWKSRNRENKSAELLLDKDISAAERGGDALSDVIYSLRYDAGTIWQMWDPDEKLLFKKWLGSHWMLNRHAMPLHNAYRLQALFKEKRLKVFSGLKEVEFIRRSRKFNLALEDREAIAVDILINATGSPSQLSDMGFPLVDNLLKKEYLSSHPVGGTLIDELTMQTISPKGGDGIYAIGHLANGMLLDVNSVWFNVRTASVLCKHILSKIENGRIS